MVGVSHVLHEPVQDLHRSEIEREGRDLVPVHERLIGLYAELFYVREHGAHPWRVTPAEELLDLVDRVVDSETGALRRVREQLDHRRQHIPEGCAAERTRGGGVATLKRSPRRVAIHTRGVQIRYCDGIIGGSQGIQHPPEPPFARRAAAWGGR